MKARVDLHLHTTASDGLLSPEALIALAERTRLDAIAITDHDTTEALGAAQAAASSVQVIPGIELSAEEDGDDVHTLGYFVEQANTTFQDALATFREARQQRGQKIVERLADLGLVIAWSAVEAQANGGAIGRPHIARALVEAGHVGSTQEAFDLYLHNGGPAYVSRRRMTPEEAIELIHSAGGVAVMAHPGALRDYAAMIKRLAAAGLDGVEVVHPINPPEVQRRLRRLAEEHHLIMTGGSDFHGPEADGSVSIGSVQPPAGCVAVLRERAEVYARS